MVAGVVCALAGCASLFPSRGLDLTVRHDFGPSPVYHPRAAAPVQLRVRAMPWLTGTGIDYRRPYQHPTAVYTYADNRWLAPPAVLLAARLRAALGPAPAVTAGPPLYRLVVTIRSFSQDFQTAAAAQAHLQITAGFYDAITNQRLAVKNLNLRERCPPNVHGAVEGLGHLARRASHLLAHWAIIHARWRG